MNDSLQRLNEAYDLASRACVKLAKPVHFGSGDADDITRGIVDGARQALVEAFNALRLARSRVAAKAQPAPPRPIPASLTPEGIEAALTKGRHWTETMMAEQNAEYHAKHVAAIKAQEENR